MTSKPLNTALRETENSGRESLHHCVSVLTQQLRQGASLPQHQIKSKIQRLAAKLNELNLPVRFNSKLCLYNFTRRSGVLDLT